MAPSIDEATSAAAKLQGNLALLLAYPQLLQNARTNERSVKYTARRLALPLETEQQANDGVELEMAAYDAILTEELAELAGIMSALAVTAKATTSYFTNTFSLTQESPEDVEATITISFGDSA